MTRFGLTLSSEEHPPRRLVDLAVQAEDLGFDFVSISDHYHPWLPRQGHASFVWSVLGAIAAATERIDVAVGVTCPIMRIHPAVLAQATATTSGLLGDRFTWGVGTGEYINEHILGDRWPPADVRVDMLGEAIEVIRELWKGESVTFSGDYFYVEDATIFDTPAAEIPIVVSAFGPEAARLAAEEGDGLWIVGAGTDTIGIWREHGGAGPLYSQLTFCLADDRDKAIDIAHRQWPNSQVTGQVKQDLRTPYHLELASEIVTRDQIARALPCGPDPGPLIEKARAAIDNGVDHLYFHQIGDDQERFLGAWTETIAPELR